MLTVTAANAAGSTSSDSITVNRSSVTVTLDSIPSDQLNQATINVTGTVSDPSCEVWVNGIQASVNTDDGTWEADIVPVGTGRTAIFDVEVYSATTANFSRTHLRFSPQANNLGGNNIGSQFISQPRAIKVGAVSYSSNQHESSVVFVGCGLNYSTYYEGKDTVVWFIDSGGTELDVGSTKTMPADFEDGTWAHHYMLPAGEDVISPPWEYSALTGMNIQENIGCDDFHRTWDNHTETRVMIEPQGQVPVGSTNTYLVRANASEFSSPPDPFGPGGSSGDVPLRPEWLQIDGHTLINSGITNEDDGAVWGETIVSAPAGENVDVTPTATQIYQYEDYTFNVQAVNLNLQLAADANRDGRITLDTADQTSVTQPYRFWVNNDHDGYDSSIGDYDDLDPSTGTDAQNFSISCTRDLEDYTRLWINTQGITEELQNGTFLLALEWKDAVDDPQMQLFQAAEADGGSLYLVDTNAAAQQVASPYGTRLIEWRHLNTLTKYNPFIFPTNFWSNFSADQPVAHLLFDAVSRGSGKLVISIYKNDGVTRIAECPQPLYLKLQDVKEMYERWTVGESGTPATTASLVTMPYSYDSTIPAENNYILFVHGWNLAPWERNAFAETAFKRLYWQGYKGRFGAFQWPTQYGFSGNVSGILDADNFDNSEFNAWSSAPALRGLLSSLNGQYSGHVDMFAHSMGNVVAGEALKLAGSSQVVNTYVAMQAAIASHAYDPATYVRTNDLNYLGIGYNSRAPNYYASYYTNGAPSYFNGTAGAANYINFYNQRDYALACWEVDEDFKPDDHAGFSYNSSANKFYLIGTELYFPHNTYVVFPYCATAFCYGLGEQANVGGAFLSLGEPNQLNLDSTFHFGNSHAGHSAEFNSDNMSRAAFWNTLLNQMGLLQ